MRNLDRASATGARAIIRYLATQQPPIPAQVTARVRGAQTLTYRLRVNPQDVKRVLGLDEPLAYVLAAESLRIVRERGTLAMEVPLDAEDFAPVPPTSLPPQKGLVVALGRTSAGRVLTVDLGSPNCAHVLVCALTGGGKSETLRTVLHALAKQNDPQALRFLLVDCKGGLAFADFASVGHLTYPVITDPVEACQALAWAVRQLQERANGGGVPYRLVLAVDEIQEIIQAVGDKTACDLLAPITRLGRELGIHLLAATQHPTAQVLGGSLVKCNFGLRLVGRVGDARASFLATGQDGLEAHKLRGRGDFLAVTGGQAHRLQVAHTTPQDIAGLTTENGFEHIAFAVVGPLQLAEGGDAAEREPKGRPFSAEELAVALSSDMGINRLQGALHIGTKRATRLRKEAQDLRAALAELGYTLTGGNEDER